MNGELLPDKFYMQLKFKSETKRPFTLFTLSNSDEKWTNESIQMEIADFFRGLQTYLRQASVAVQEGQELPDQPITPNKPEPPTPIEEDLFGSTIGGVRRMEYDPSRCPACGSAIARDAKKCPICGRKKLPELVTPYKFNSACWYVGEKKFGIEKASGPLTILDDRIELKRVFGNPPKAIFWMRDIVSVREGSYGLNAPSIVITMKDGQAHTFVPSGNHDRTRGAVALIRQLIRR